MNKATKTLILALAVVSIASLGIKRSSQLKAQDEPIPPIPEEPLPVLEGPPFPEVPEESQLPGRIEDTGTFFEVKNSEHLNITLESSEEITVVLESVPETISLNLEASTSTDSTILTISDLEPNKTYYKFEDSYKNEVVFTSSENGSYAILQDLTKSHHIWFQKENATIYIPDQCSAVGDWDEETSTCTLNQDIKQSVEITEDNIILNCNNHNLTGYYRRGFGIYLYRRKNVTVKNCNISHFSSGICLSDSSGNTFVNNIISDSYRGIYLSSSNNDTFGNNIASNNSLGIYLYKSGSNVLVDNIANSNKEYGSRIENVIASENYYGIYLHSSKNNTLANNAASNNYYSGIRLWKSDSNTLADNTANLNNYGIDLYFSNNNTLANNVLSNNSSGIYLHKANGNTLTNNIAESNRSYGIYLYYGSYANTLTNNIVSNNSLGICLRDSGGNILSDNITNSNIYGIQLSSSSGNTLTGNMALKNYSGIVLSNRSDDNKIIDSTISNNDYYGILLYSSSDSKIYHNNLIENGYGQVRVSWGTGNLFDDSYPAGGNYWSDYIGIDEKSGPNQDQSGSDGIGDIPYTFTGGQDRYPFMTENGWLLIDTNPPEISNPSVGPLSLRIGETLTVKATIIDASGVMVVKAKLGDLATITLFDDGEHDDREQNDNIYANSWVIPEETAPGIYTVTISAMDNFWNETSDSTQSFEVLEVPVKTYDVAVILAEPGGTPHNSSRIITSLCHLSELQNKIYENGHGKNYYEDLAECVNDYYKENSYETIQFNFEILDNNGEWYKLLASMQDYRRVYGLSAENKFTEHAIKKTGLDFSSYDIVNVTHAGDESEFSNQTWPPQFHPLGFPPYKFIASEDNFTGTWAHEMGHILGALITPDNTIVSDLYPAPNRRYTNLGQWDLMANGSRNNGGKNPPWMSSYVREFLGWLNYEGNIHQKSDYGEHWITALENSKLGDPIFRYNLEDNISPDTPEYYLLETRNRNLEKWDSSLPEEKALVLYYIDENNCPENPGDHCPEYGYEPGAMSWNQRRRVEIPGLSNPDNNGVLNLQVQESYRDLNNLVSFRAISDGWTDNQYRIQAEINQMLAPDFPYRFAGVILKPNSTLEQKIPFPGYTEGAIGETTIKGIIKDKLLKKNPVGSTYEVFEIKIIKSEPYKKLIGQIIEVWWTSDTDFNPEDFRISDFISGRLEIVREDVWYPGKEMESYRVLSLKRINLTESKEKLILISSILFLVLLLLVVILRIKLKTNKKLFKILIIIFAIGLISTLVILFILSQRETTSSIISEPAYGQVTNPSFGEVPLIQPVIPDLDLHAITPDGKHIGVNYETSEFENQIPSSIISGDNYSVEWIFVPVDTEVRYYVSSYDTERFFIENPEIARQIEDKSDGYEIYARYIDPVADIYTSAVISQDIEPGVQQGHLIVGTHEEVIVTPADAIPPATTISLSDTLGKDNWYLSDVKVTLGAQDNEDGVGVAKTEYSLDDGETWIIYIEPFSISFEGISKILYRSQDFVGNLEETKEQEVKIDKTPPKITMPVFEESYTYKQLLKIEFWAIDAVSGIESTIATLNGQPIISGQEIILDKLGTNVFEVTAIDKAGLSKTETKEFKVFYDFSGFLPPLSKKAKFNLGQDIPVKFQLKDAEGNYVSDIQPRIYIAQIINGEPWPEQPAHSSGKANTENVARYDPDRDQYVFNLSTKDLSPGQCQIRTDLSDESIRIIKINLEKSGNKK